MSDRSEYDAWNRTLKKYIKYKLKYLKKSQIYRDKIQKIIKLDGGNNIFSHNIINFNANINDIYIHIKANCIMKDLMHTYLFMIDISKTVKDKTVKDKTVKDKTVKDKTVKDKTVKDKTVKDKIFKIRLDVESEINNSDKIISNNIIDCRFNNSDNLILDKTSYSNDINKFTETEQKIILKSIRNNIIDCFSKTNLKEILLKEKLYLD